MMERTCCVTGHREIAKEKWAHVNEELEKAIIQAVQQGYTRFISGYATGVDLAFAAIVVRLKQQGCAISLEAAIPHESRLKSKDAMFQNLLAACDQIKVLHKHYSKGSYFTRDRYMVDESSLVIAVYDGRNGGGTRYTMTYAAANGKSLHIIEL